MGLGLLLLFFKFLALDESLNDPLKLIFVNLRPVVNEFNWAFSISTLVSYVRMPSWSFAGLFLFQVSTVILRPMRNILIAPSGAVFLCRICLSASN